MARIPARVTWFAWIWNIPLAKRETRMKHRAPPQISALRTPIPLLRRASLAARTPMKHSMRTPAPNKRLPLAWPARLGRVKPTDTM